MRLVLRLLQALFDGEGDVVGLVDDGNGGDVEG